MHVNRSHLSSQITLITLTELTWVNDISASINYQIHSALPSHQSGQGDSAIKLKPGQENQELWEKCCSIKQQKARKSFIVFWMKINRLAMTFYISSYDTMAQQSIREFENKARSRNCAWVKAWFSQHKLKKINICICVRRDHCSSFSCHSFFSLFLHKWLITSWLKTYFYIYPLFFIIHLKGFPRLEFSLCRLGCTVTVPRHRRALDKIREDVDAFVFEGRWLFLWPLPLSQDETTPPSEATTPCCYVESRLTAFPPFMVGVPELFLERCFSSISCSDGSLYIQTVAEVQRQGWKWEKEKRRRQ